MLIDSSKDSKTQNGAFYVRLEKSETVVKSGDTFETAVLARMKVWSMKQNRYILNRCL